MSQPFPQMPSSWVDSLRDRFVANQFVVFNVLWAVAHVAHMLRKGPMDDLAGWAVLLFSLLLIDKPGSRVRLAALAVAQIAFLGTVMPFADNHLYIMGFVNAGLLVGLGVSRLRDQKGESGGIEAAFGYVRISLLLAYGAAAVAKLNGGFFDTSESCAVTMFYDAALTLAPSGFVLPSGFVWLLPFLIAGIELSVPLLLFVRRTRLAAVLLIVPFHWSISISVASPGLAFTIVLFAILFLFLPAEAAERARNAYDRVAALFPKAYSPNVLVRTSLIVFGFCTLTYLLELQPASVGRNPNWLVVAPLALLLGGWLMYLALATRRGTWGELGARKMRPTHLALAALLLANAATPYVGYKNAGTFTMFSNLLTVSDASNHLLIPTVSIFSHQNDLVKVVASSNPVLQSHVNEGLLITWHELRRHLASDPDASVSYARNGGEVLHLAHARDEPALVRRDPIRHWFVGFRDFDPDRARCVW